MFKKIMNILTTFILVILVVSVLFFFGTRLMGKTPSVFGNYVFRVSSESMEPTLKVGDVILVHSVKAEDIHKGDIVTYTAQSGEMRGREITHRVVEEPVVTDGSYHYQTKGDAPNATLDPEISYSQIRGKFVIKLVVIGWFFNTISTPIGMVVFIGLIILLFGYEMVSLLVSYKSIDTLDEEAEKQLKDKDKNKK